MGNSVLVGQKSPGINSYYPSDLGVSISVSSVSEKKDKDIRIDMSMSTSLDNSDSTERITIEPDQQFRDTLRLLNPIFIQAAHRLMDEPIERRAFMSFLDTDLWLDYVDMKLGPALMEVSNAFMQDNSSQNVRAMSDQAKEVLLDELDMDSALNADRMRIENCFTSRELRYLTLCVFLNAYLSYCSSTDIRPLPPSSTSSSSPQPNQLPAAAVDASSATQHPSSNDNTSDSIELPPDSVFFLSPIDLLQRIKFSTSSREFSRIVSTGTWLTEVCLLVDRLDLALYVHTANQASGHKSSDGVVVYGNQEFVSSYPTHVSLPECPYSPVPTKTRKQLPSTVPFAMHQSVLVSTLPLNVSRGQYTLCMHHSITKATAHQQILLRLSDFILLVVGSMLE